MPGQGGVRSSPPAPTLAFSPPQHPQRTPSHPVSPASGPAKPRLPREGGRREAKGMESRSEPSRPCGAGAGHARLRGKRPLQMLWLRLGEWQWPRCPRGREKTSSRPGCAPPLAPRRCCGSALSPALPGRPGIQSRSKQESGAHRQCAALASAPAPGSSAPVSPCRERQDQLREQRTSFLLETRTGSGD